MTKKNPFITKGYAGPEYFCDREKETRLLVKWLTNSNNVALISPRRYGKTDLIRHIFAQPEIDNDYLNELFSDTQKGEMCNVEDIDIALNSILDASSVVYENMMYQLPDKQRTVLKAIAMAGVAERPTSMDFVRRYQLSSPNSVKSALPALVDKDLVMSDKGKYLLCDKFLELWLK